MKDQLISFKTAKLAKKKGFKIPVHYNWYPDGTQGSDFEKTNWNRSDVLVSAPTQSLLQRWLRQRYHLWVEVTVFGDGVGTQCMIKEADPTNREDDQSRIVLIGKLVNTGIYMSLEFDYEKTLEKGLYEALELING